MTIDVLCSVISLICALLLISHCKYEEGLVGRAALLMLILSETIVTAQAWNDDSYVLAPTTVLRHVAITVFLVRHTYRFMSFYYCGKNHWKNSEEQKT